MAMRSKKLAIAAALAGGLIVAPAAIAEEKAAKASDKNPYGDATKATTDSMMKMMGGMFDMWSAASRPMWESTSQIFGEYGEWCIVCHTELDSAYQKLGETFDPDIHKKLSDEDLAKAADAYDKSKADE